MRLTTGLATTRIQGNPLLRFLRSKAVIHAVRRDRAAEFLRSFNPLLGNHLNIGKSFFVRFSVRRAPRQLGHLGDERVIHLAPINDDLVPTHLRVPNPRFLRVGLSIFPHSPSKPRLATRPARTVYPLAPSFEGSLEGSQSKCAEARAISLWPALVTNPLCRGKEKRTLHKL